MDYIKIKKHYVYNPILMDFYQLWLIIIGCVGKNKYFPFLIDSSPLLLWFHGHWLGHPKNNHFLGHPNPWKLIFLQKIVCCKLKSWNSWQRSANLESEPPPPPQIDQVKILHPSVHFNLNLLSAACKMLYSDWLKIRTQNQVNILSPKLIWSGGGC